MKVKELIETLKKFPEDAEVMEARNTEHRVLNPEDIILVNQVFNPDSGDVEDGYFLIFAAWE